MVRDGCASAPGAPGVNDPYGASNRAIFDFNLKADHLALRPTAERYQSWGPDEVRDSLRNALDNLHAPVVIANDHLQAEGSRASTMAGRFLSNSTLGLGGRIDVAGRWGLASHDEDLRQTLARWGVGEGPYSVQPPLGPSHPRDIAGKAGDVALDPGVYFKIERHLLWERMRQYLTIVDTRARNLEAFDAIERDSLDFYASVRSFYRQNRTYQIRNGTPAGDE